jgi:hypothetical protein
MFWRILAYRRRRLLWTIDRPRGLMKAYPSFYIRGVRVLVKISILAFSACLLAACASEVPKENAPRSASVQSRETASVNPQKFDYHFELDRAAGERYRPDDTAASEEVQQQRLITLFSAHFAHMYGNPAERASHSDQNENGKALRAVHAKGHGCLTGTFTVIDHGHPEFKHGVFKEPKAHDVVIRYSNGDGPPGSDADKTISVGMAFKLLNIPDTKLLGALQTENSVDFLMTNHANFIVRDVREFADVIDGREKGLLEKVGAVVVAHKGLLQRLHVNKKDPLVTPYWSNLPFKLNDVVIKYLVKPESCPGETNTGEVLISKKESKDPDFLTTAVYSHARRHSACFGFYLQKQASAQLSPVEDAFVIWPENGYLTRVATLQIPAQEPNENLKFLSPLNRSGQAGKDICQNLSFSPWNTTTDLKPLSSLNRARRVVYELSTAMRRDINHTSNPAQPGH